MKESKTLYIAKRLSKNLDKNRLLPEGNRQIHSRHQGERE